MTDVDTHPRFALVGPTGRLVFRSASPKQMLQDVTVGASLPHEFTIISASRGGPGLHACITSIDRPLVPPNELAGGIISALGGARSDRWLGILGLCGSKIDPPLASPCCAG